MNQKGSPGDTFLALSNLFIGRTDELAHIAELLSDPTCRLVTLAGPGGIGKTRLAGQAAQLLTQNFTLDDIYFVALQPLSAPDQILSAMADAIGFQFYGSVEPRQQLIDYLRSRRLLLILDNFEHLLLGTDLIVELLAQAPKLKFLVTSREALNLQEEWLYRIKGLAYPQHADDADLENYEAIRLFVENARHAIPTFTLHTDKALVVRLCQIVDGMPLALEILAAWLKRLPMRQIVEQIESGLDVLQNPARHVPARHRSMRATFDQSWYLLNDAERAVFMKVSVFRNSFDLEAAQRVAQATLQILSELVDKSLLWVDDNGRYMIHELLRQYAAEHLKNAALTEQIQDAHADYFAAYMSVRWLDMKGHRQVEALREVEHEFNNLRGAWLHLINLSEPRGSNHIVDFSSALWMFAELRSRYQEMADLFEQALRIWRNLPVANQPLFIIGHVMALQGRIVTYLGLPERAKVLALEAIDTLTRFDNIESLILAWHALCFCGFYLAEVATTREAAEQSLKLSQQSGNRWGLGLSLYCLASVSDQPMPLAISLYRDCFNTAEAMGNLWQMGAASLQLGVAALETSQDYFEARHHMLLALRCFEKLGTRRNISRVLLTLAQVNIALKDFVEARQYIQQALQLRLENGDQAWALIEVLERYGDLLHGENQNEQALAVLSMILHHPASVKVSRYWAEIKRATLKDQLPPALYAAAWQRGQMLMIDNVLEDILHPTQPKPALDETGYSLTEPLTERELEILRLIADGLSNQAIARQIFLTAGTVKWYVSEILSKLQAANRTQAVAHARNLKLLD